MVVTLVAALMVASVSAQTPSAAPTANAPVGSIPERIPPNLRANGWDQAGWTALREHCRALFNEVAASQTMSPEQIKALPPVPYSEYESCRNLSGSFSRAARAAVGSGPAPAPSGATPPTPLPHVQLAIPVTPPPGWVPKQWTDLRAHCQEIADKAAAHHPLAPDDWHVAPICGSLGPQPTPPPGAYPLPASSGASAQSLSAAPTVNAPVGSIPGKPKPPQWWAADGGTQASWMAFRQRCADIAVELARRQGMTYKQLEASPGLSFSRDEWLRCGILSPSAGQAGPALSPSTSSAATPPTPMPTPVPPEFPVGPRSLEPGT